MRRIPALLVLLLATSCSSKKEGTGTSVADVPAFCSEWAKGACNDTVVGFCGATSAGSCAQTQQAFCEGLVPSSKYSSKTADECLKAVADAYSDGQLTAAERSTVLRLGAPCDKILSGTGAKDATCKQDSDCNRDDDLSCVRKADGTGKCEVPKPALRGDDCSDADALCETGYYCDPGNHCVQDAKVGQACSDTKPCGADSRCGQSGGQTPTGDAGVDAGGAAAPGGTLGAVCEALKPSGDCTSDAECESGICAVASGGKTGKCVKSTAITNTDRICDALQ